jgi:hypothetical protein
MNRGVEITSGVADGPQSAIQQQVRNGVTHGGAGDDRATCGAQRAGRTARGLIVRMTCRSATSRRLDGKGSRRMSAREHRGTIFVEDASCCRSGSTRASSS